METTSPRKHKSHSTGEYFPFVSANICRFITEQLVQHDYDFVIEYGSGGSTIYYLQALLEAQKRCVFTSVEYNPDWFHKMVERSKPCGLKMRLQVKSMNVIHGLSTSASAISMVAMRRGWRYLREWGASRKPRKKWVDYGVFACHCCGFFPTAVPSTVFTARRLKIALTCS